jgi:uncharacterized protein YjdB
METGMNRRVAWKPMAMLLLALLAAVAMSASTTVALADEGPSAGHDGPAVVLGSQGQLEVGAALVEVGESPAPTSSAENNPAIEESVEGRTTGGVAPLAEDGPAAVELEAQDSAAHVAYRTHVQTYGWQGFARDGEVSGTSGQAKRLEGIELRFEGAPYAGSIQYRTHVQGIGWQGWVADGAMAGTSGQARRLEAIEIRLAGEMARGYDVYYRVHAQSFGWMGWARNGERAGTATMGKRLEAIQVVLHQKGWSAPPNTYRGITSAYARPYATRQVRYRTHVQTYGWQGWSFDGEMAGTSGQAKRLEGVEIALADPLYSGSVQYRTHVQTYGWQGWVQDGAMSGTSGQAKRLEAIQIRLTDEMAQRYDVWYRVHAQTFGWMGWASNGASAGTEGWAKRLEAIEIVLTAKGAAAPGSTAGAFNKYVGKPYKVKYDLTHLKTVYPICFEGGDGYIGGGLYIPGSIAEYRTYFGSRGSINVPATFYDRDHYVQSIYAPIPDTPLQIEYFGMHDEREAAAVSIKGRLGDLVEGLPNKSMSLRELAGGLRSLGGEVDSIALFPNERQRDSYVRCGLCYLNEVRREIYYAENGARMTRALRVDATPDGMVTANTVACISANNYAVYQ